MDGGACGWVRVQVGDGSLTDVRVDGDVCGDCFRHFGSCVQRAGWWQVLLCKYMGCGTSIANRKRLGEVEQGRMDRFPGAPSGGEYGVRDREGNPLVVFDSGGGDVEDVVRSRQGRRMVEFRRP